MSRAPFLEKLTLLNFRSILHEEVTFDNPLFLVGRNGSGKSNLLDAIAFLSECMDRPLQSVIDSRGGTWAICTRLPESSKAVFIRIRADFRLYSTQSGYYEIFLNTSEEGSFHVIEEACEIHFEGGREPISFHRDGERFLCSVPGIRPSLDKTGLALPALGGVQEFAPVLKAFSAMRVYAIEPQRIRETRDADSGATLKRDASNVVSVLYRLANRDTGILTRVSELLKPIVPGLSNLRIEKRGKNLDLLFTQETLDGKYRFDFDVSEMSEGTLRALGFVTTVLQEPMPKLLAIEEPENTIHPGALDLVSGLIETAALRTQVLLTTHSPELLDTKWILPKHLRIVEWKNGFTRISPLGSVPVKSLQQHLMGAGELLRANALDAAPPEEKAAVA